jgi:UDP-N-acetylglucosamine acyltransferase|uniref:Acyl-[ACP]--UDP-N-acetylglucosamine O-acyltransferase n=1 Tax=Cyanidiaceae sp. MX-AZ01 TaxID=1503164 RepID=A0A060A8R2_9RHOD|nr:acyl-[ACP]--UDP-N-acetylglucosamine O-acyltransferase [Cyanidiaceae sp. MX-AZ01]
MIHPTALVHPKAKIGKNVTIGAYSVIAQHVYIGENTKIGAHVVIDGMTYIGKSNQIMSFCSIGMVPQDLKYNNAGITYIGNQNFIREYVSIHRGTRGITYIGDQNLLMCYVHVAHDCQIANHVILVNGVNLAGHVRIASHGVVGGLSGVHQFVEIGRLSMIGGMSKIDRDVPPYMIVEGNPARIRGINLVGLRRKHIPEKHVTALKKMWMLMKKTNWENQIEDEYVQQVQKFWFNSHRGVIEI